MLIASKPDFSRCEMQRLVPDDGQKICEVPTICLQRVQAAPASVRDVVAEHEEADVERVPLLHERPGDVVEDGVKEGARLNATLP